MAAPVMRLHAAVIHRPGRWLHGCTPASRRDLSGHVLAETAIDRCVVVPGGVVLPPRAHADHPTWFLPRRRGLILSHHTGFISDSLLLLFIPIATTYPSPPTRLTRSLSRWPSPHGRQRHRTRPALRFSSSGAPTSRYLSRVTYKFAPPHSIEREPRGTSGSPRAVPQRPRPRRRRSLPTKPCPQSRQAAVVGCDGDRDKVVDAFNADQRRPMWPSCLDAGSDCQKRDWD